MLIKFLKNILITFLFLLSPQSISAYWKCIDLNSEETQFYEYKLTNEKVISVYDFGESSSDIVLKNDKYIIHYSQYSDFLLIGIFDLENQTKNSFGINKDGSQMSKTNSMICAIN